MGPYRVFVSFVTTFKTCLKIRIPTMNTKTINLQSKTTIYRMINTQEFGLCHKQLNMPPTNMDGLSKTTFKYFGRFNSIFICWKDKKIFPM